MSEKVTFTIKAPGLSVDGFIEGDVLDVRVKGSLRAITKDTMASDIIPETPPAQRTAKGKVQVKDLRQKAKSAPVVKTGATPRPVERLRKQVLTPDRAEQIRKAVKKFNDNLAKAKAAAAMAPKKA